MPVTPKTIDHVNTRQKGSKPSHHDRPAFRADITCVPSAEPRVCARAYCYSRSARQVSSECAGSQARHDREGAGKQLALSTGAAGEHERADKDIVLEPPPSLRAALPRGVSIACVDQAQQQIQHICRGSGEVDHDVSGGLP